MDGAVFINGAPVLKLKGRMKVVQMDAIPSSVL